MPWLFLHPRNTRLSTNNHHLPLPLPASSSQLLCTTKIKMGQAMKKLTGQGDIQTELKQSKEIKDSIDKYINDNKAEFDAAIQTPTFDRFYHMVYKIVEYLNEASRATMHFRLPSIEALKKEFDKVRRSGNPTMTKDEFQQIIEGILTLDSFYVGQGATDVFLYIFGIPVVALLAKRMIPGPGRAIPDDIFIPAATTGAVVFLAKTHRL